MRTHRDGRVVHVLFKQDGMNLIREYETPEAALDFVQSGSEEGIEFLGMRLMGGTWLSPVNLANLVSMDDRDRAGSLKVTVEADELRTQVGASPLLESNDSTRRYFESAVSFAVVACADIIDRAMTIGEHVRTSLYGCHSESGIDCWEGVYTNRATLLFEIVLLVSCVAAFLPALRGYLFREMAKRHRQRPKHD